MIQKHYFFFGNEIQKEIKGNSLNEENWESLRNNEAATHFSIEKTIEAYEANCKKSASYEQSAEIIIKEIEKRNDLNSIVSLGVGKGILEWHLKNIRPDLQVECTDYTTEAIERLKSVFRSVDAAYTFDMLNGDYSTLRTNAIVLMYRVSTEFDFKQWQNIFIKMYNADVKDVIFVPTELATKEDMKAERISHLKCILTGRKDIFCGWLYSEDEFLKIFRGPGPGPLYNIESRIPVENTAVFYLKKNISS